MNNNAFQESLVKAVPQTDSATADGAMQTGKQLEEAVNAGMHDHSSMLVFLWCNCYCCGGGTMQA